MWGNDVHGDCVTAEEAFAKACHNPEIFISDNEVITWATNHGVLEGANLVPVMQWMQNDGFLQNGSTYDDGPYFSVNWADPATLQSAISMGPVKIGVAADQLETAWRSTGGRTGWFGMGFHSDAAEDHCVSLCGYGPLSWLAQQLHVQVPAGVNGATQGYALFTWNTIGIIDQPSMVAITHEAWLRQPTTVIPAALNFVAAGDLEDGRIQVFGIEPNGQIVSRWKETTDPSSAWTAWSGFQTPSGGVSSICVSYLSDKRMQLFATNAQGATVSCWKTTTNPSAAWTAWSAFDGAPLKFIAAGDLEDGRIQLFGIEPNGQIVSRWKQTADPSSAWTAWSGFQTPSGGVGSICVGSLSDGRMQLFATNAQGATISCWKTTTNPSAAWTAWSAFDGTPLKFVAAGDLEDGRIQLFGIEPNGQIVSRWKQTADPNSAWTAWAGFQTPSEGVTSICVGYLSDKRMQLFATNAQGATFSCWKTTTNPSAAWTAWSAF
jgi:hypothetical protein